jgi:hypothetical protein
MKAGRMLGVVVASTLLLGAVGAELAAAKKRKTGIVLNSGSPSVNMKKKVRARGSLRSTQECRRYRGMKLFLTDAGGAVLAVLDSRSTDRNGNFNLRGNLPKSVAAGAAVSIQLKAIKKDAGKDFCRAGLLPRFQLIVPPRR